MFGAVHFIYYINSHECRLNLSTAHNVLSICLWRPVGATSDIEITESDIATQVE